jgi:hypothetical protein
MANPPVTNFGMGAQPSPDQPRASPREAPRPPLKQQDWDEVLRELLGLPPGQPITAQDMERLEQGSEWYRGLQRQTPTRKFPSLNNIWDK